MFTQNLGPVDRAVRLALGIALLAMIVFPPVTAWGWLGLFPLATAILGACPLYTVLGVETCAFE